MAEAWKSTRMLAAAALCDWLNASDQEWLEDFKAEIDLAPGEDLEKYGELTVTVVPLRRETSAEEAYSSRGDDVKVNVGFRQLVPAGLRAGGVESLVWMDDRAALVEQVQDNLPVGGQVGENFQVMSVEENVVGDIESLRQNALWLASITVTMRIFVSVDQAG